MKIPYAQQRNVRQRNTSVLLSDLWLNAPLSRAMLAQRNGLTKATVSSICDELTALNLIREAGQDRNGVGRPGNLLELNPDARSAIGLELSTNYVAAVLADFCGRVLWRQAVPVPPHSPEETILHKADNLLAAASAQAQQLGTPLLGIGVAAPGLVDSGRGIVVSAPALGWRDTVLKARWEEHFSMPVMVENKARSAAMAEALYGAARGVKNFVCVTIGTDVGSTVDAAVVIDGIPYRGAHGLGVDAGHMILDARGELCICGQRGCWQAQADVGREAALVSARLASGAPSKLQGRPIEELSDHRTVHQAALEHDELAMEVFKSVITLSHAPGILNLISLFDPELVLIGFANVGLPAEFQARMDALMDYANLSIANEVCEQLHMRGLTPPAIRRATYGPDTIMLGATSLLVDDFLRAPPVTQP